MAWMLRDNYGNPHYELGHAEIKTGSRIEMTYRIQQFASKGDAEAFIALQIVGGIWDEGVWQAEKVDPKIKVVP